ncbi:ABC transporter permease [Antrihabitans cavernicola]|uniref:ABC transporter permease n=1 Tax=Antrihabitans cavernicola TaxID=2495913 RepID=A0A5A7SD71_9NOCA|nr:ABC transporter permease [Spelaeibacter cavernicola]KAA0022533.1 hypothetical protein FOY51_12595 [Spelaeibacter cavernicola]
MTTGLLVAEIRKVTTLKFWWALLIPPLIVGLFASAIYAGIADETGDLGDDFATGIASVGLYFALAWVVLFAGVFGAINAGTEYRHKTLTPTFLTASGRDGVIAAKLLVTAGFALGYGVIVELASLICMVAFGGDRLDVNGTLFQAFTVGLVAVVCWSLIGAGLGLLMASPTGAALMLVAWYVVGELTVSLVASGMGLKGFGSILPGSATIATVALGELDGDSGFADWPLAPILMLAWTVALAGSGWWATRQRDIT